MAIEVQLKKWGNSIGVVLPRELVEQRKLKESDKVIIEVVKVSNLSNIYGLIKERKMSGQKMKDLARKGWESASDRARWKK
ncbi:MAG TPA: AbrB/MazE/SpoVT family DNA-binding domain-containing protein [Candidatus Nanoarchaeia archaeon]|nr:AbrB/MazE/SpoVT family DNA-binding domain-containing protein [Candidatus Nanoarchaeia archaeon]